MNSLEMNPHSAQVVPPTDICAVVTLDLKIGEYQGAMKICIPYSALEDVISNLNRQTAYKNERYEDDDYSRQLMLNRLNATKLDVRIVLARGELMLSEIMNLQVGDIIKLNSSPEDLSEVWVGTHQKFVGSPGQLGNKYSVTIVDTYIED